MKTIYLVNPMLELHELACEDSAKEARFRAVAKKYGSDVFDTKTEALTAIELCRDQHRKNLSKEAA